MSLLVVWALYTGIASLGFIAAFLWAVRACQFADQDRARFLPLDTRDRASELLGRGGDA
ncbi:MAG TPA: hypothetical protein VGN26_15100 [Armatimonadota bacterium]|jgi:cbb3-type cytochrome oxidase maturation protein